MQNLWATRQKRRINCYHWWKKTKITENRYIYISRDIKIRNQHLIWILLVLQLRLNIWWRKITYNFFFGEYSSILFDSKPNTVASSLTSCYTPEFSTLHIYSIMLMSGLQATPCFNCAISSVINFFVTGGSWNRWHLCKLICFKRLLLGLFYQLSCSTAFDVASYH